MWNFGNEPLFVEPELLRVWNLGEPELSRVRPSCGTLGNRNLYVEPGNFQEWDLFVEPWGT